MDLKISNEVKEKTLYNFYSAKMIYFEITPSKVLLVEKKPKLVLSLVSRNTVIINKKNGILLYRNIK